MRYAQPSILTKVIIMLDNYFKTNPGVKDLSRPEIEPQSPSPLSDAKTIRPRQPQYCNTHTIIFLIQIFILFTFSMKVILSFSAKLFFPHNQISCYNYCLQKIRPSRQQQKILSLWSLLTLLPFLYCKMTWVPLLDSSVLTLFLIGKVIIGLMYWLALTLSEGQLILCSRTPWRWTLTQPEHTFDTAVNKGPTHLKSVYFLSQPVWIFLTRREKNKKIWDF